MVSFEEITSTLEDRFDWYSARTTLRQALKAASLTEKQSYDPQEVEAIAAVLPSLGTRVEGVVAQLRGLSGDGAKAAPKKAAAAKEPDPPAAEAPAEAAAEAPAEAAAEAAAEADSEADPEESADEGGDEGDTKARRGRRKK